MSYWRTEPHTMSDEDRLRAAMRLIRIATGDDHPGESCDWITDAGIGYTAGSGPAAGMTDVWVTGNWNDIRRTDRIGRTVVDTTPKRLFEALERIGVSGEWLDEYERCADCQQLIRTQPDSYWWTPQYVAFESGDTVCADCLRADAESVLADQYVGRIDRAITWLSADELAELGWRDAMPDDADAANGWHPGQDDTPQAIVDAWRLTRADDGRGAEYVFLITDKGQFDIHYRLFYRDVETDDDDSDDIDDVAAWRAAADIERAHNDAARDRWELDQ